MNNLPDILAGLQSNVLLQSQAFSALISIIRKPPSSIKDREKVFTIFYDCMGQYGSFVASLADAVIPSLVAEGCLNKKEIKVECSIRMARPEFRSPCVRTILTVNKENFLETCIDIIQRDGAAIMDVVEFSITTREKERVLPLMYALLLCDDVSKEVKFSMMKVLQSLEADGVKRFVEKFCDSGAQQFLSIDCDVKRSSTELEQNCSVSSMIMQLLSSTPAITNVDPILLASRLVEMPSILLNEHFKPHHVYIPVLLLIHQTWNEIAKVSPEALNPAIFNKVKSIMTECKSIKKSEVEDIRSSLDSYDKYLKFVAANNNVDEYAEMWLSKEKKFTSCPGRRSSIPLYFAIGLLPFSKTPSKMLDLISVLMEKGENTEPLIFQLYMLLMTQPYFQVETKTMLNAMRALIPYRNLITPMVRLLRSLVQRNIEKNVCIEILGDIVTRYPTVFDQLLPLMVFDQSDLSESDALGAKVELMKKMFSCTDQSDALLPILTSLLQKSGVLLTAGIKVLVLVCEQDIIDLAVVRKQLQSKVQQSGNESALVEYCRLLGVACAFGEDEEDLQRTCISDLWRLRAYKYEDTDLRYAEIRAMAWTVLGQFNVQVVMETVKTNPAVVIDELLSLKSKVSFFKTEVDGLCSFIRCLLANDLETIPRPCYKQENHGMEAYFVDASDWFEILEKSRGEESWFWSATLKLFPDILYSTAESKRELVAGKLFRKLLQEVPKSEDSVINRIELFCAWRLVVSVTLRLFASCRNGDFSWARDRIREMCSQALLSVALPLTNTTFAITALAAEMLITSATESSTCLSPNSPEYRKWILSVIEFVTPNCNVNDKRLTVDGTFPIFKIDKPSVLMKDIVETSKLCDFILSKVYDSSDSLRASDRQFYSSLYSYNPLELCMEHQDRLHGLPAALMTPFLNEQGRQEEGTRNSEALLAVLEKESPDESGIKKCFSLLCKLNPSTAHDVRPKVSKFMKRFFSNRGAEGRQVVFEGAAEYSFSLWSKDRELLPRDYGYLPEYSSLRIFVDKLIREAPRSSCFMRCLYPLKRTDGKTLPPLNWHQIVSGLLPKIEEDEDAVLLNLAIQESSKKLLEEVTTSAFLKRATKSFVNILLNDLSAVIPLLSSNRIKDVLRLTEEHASENCTMELFSKGLCETIYNSAVFSYVLEKLPKIESCYSSSSIFAECFSFAYENFKGVVGSEHEIWHLCISNMHREALKKYLVANVTYRLANMRIIGRSLTCSCSETDILNHLVDLTANNVNDTIAGKLLDLVMITVCSWPVPVPFDWSPQDEVFYDALRKRFPHYWRAMLKDERFSTNSYQICGFLVKLLKCTTEADNVLIRDSLLSYISSSQLSSAELLNKYGTVLEKLIIL